MLASSPSTQKPPVPLSTSTTTTTTTTTTTADAKAEPVWSPYKEKADSLAFALEGLLERQSADVPKDQKACQYGLRCYRRNPVHFLEFSHPPKVFPLYRRAVRRLMRDFHELQSGEGLETVSAMPEDDNLFIWHVNLRPIEGPFAGGVFHLTMSYQNDYPHSPPKVTLSSDLDHPNVEGKSICLDMLNAQSTNTPYEGWSTAYGLSSVLLQLQSFLFAENIPQDDNSVAAGQTSRAAVDRALRSARAAKCTCQHTFDKPYPPFATPLSALLSSPPPSSKPTTTTTKTIKTPHAPLAAAAASASTPTLPPPNRGPVPVVRQTVAPIWGARLAKPSTTPSLTTSTATVTTTTTTTTTTAASISATTTTASSVGTSMSPSTTTAASKPTAAPVTTAVSSKNAINTTTTGTTTTTTAATSASTAAKNTATDTNTAITVTATTSTSSVAPKNTPGPVTTVGANSSTSSTATTTAAATTTTTKSATTAATTGKPSPSPAVVVNPTTTGGKSTLSALAPVFTLSTTPISVPSPTTSPASISFASIVGSASTATTSTTRTSPTTATTSSAPVSKPTSTTSATTTASSSLASKPVKSTGAPPVQTTTATATTPVTTPAVAVKPNGPPSFASILAAAASRPPPPVVPAVKKPAVPTTTTTTTTATESKSSKSTAKDSKRKESTSKASEKDSKRKESTNKTSEKERRGKTKRTNSTTTTTTATTTATSTSTTTTTTTTTTATPVPVKGLVVRVSPPSVTQAKGPSFAAIVGANPSPSASKKVITPSNNSSNSGSDSNKKASNNTPTAAATANKTVSPPSPQLSLPPSPNAANLSTASLFSAPLVPSPPSFASIAKKEASSSSSSSSLASSLSSSVSPSSSASSSWDSLALPTSPLHAEPSTQSEALTPFHRLGADITAHLLGFLWPMDIVRLNRIIHYVKLISDSYNLIERQEIRCFHSRLSFEEAILGVGISCQYYPDGALKSCTSDLDLISSVAFGEGVRFGVWGKPFSFFLPLVFNAQHAERAFERMKEGFSRIQNNMPEAPEFEQRDDRKQKAPPRFDPIQAVSVIQTLMNVMVVNMMHSADEQRVHASEKALLGYCAFHHMLLYLATRFPQIQVNAKHAVHNFLTSAEARTKRITPDIGKLLVLLTLTDASLGWEKLAIVLIKESFARSVRWYAREHPFLLQDTDRLQQGVDQKRLDTVFAASQTSLRLLMFQVYFLTTIGRPRGKNPASLLQEYNKSLGRPSEAQKRSLQAACKNILQVKSWDEYFDRVLVQRPTPLFLSNLLREAVRTSTALRYHNLDDKDGPRDRPSRDGNRSRGRDGQGDARRDGRSRRN